MGKGKVNMTNGLPSKKGQPSREILGPVPYRIVDKLYKRVAYRLPVFQKYLSQNAQEYSLETKKLEQI